MQYTICKLTSLKICEIEPGLFIREDGFIRRKYKNLNKYSKWTPGTVTERDYRKVMFNKIRYFVHRLVAKAFVPNPENKPYVDHIDRLPNNNKASNLRWVTQSENCSNSSRNKKWEQPWISKQGRKWKVSANIEGRPTLIGLYDTQTEAEQAYLKIG